MQANALDHTLSSPDAPTAPQLVQMSRAELDLYVKHGRPTGLLLRSVAQLKGMSATSVAQASGIPSALVESIFNDHGAASIKKSAIRRVSVVLGIDLAFMRFAAGQVHVINLERIQGRMNRNAARLTMRAVGLLARGAHVAELQVGSGVSSLAWRGRMHVAQSGSFRVLFVGSMTKKFDIGFLPSANWVCRSRKDSVVHIENAELAKALVGRDLTEGEFDELFLGASALTWDDVRVASRVNGVSKAELMQFIASRAQEADATENDAAKREAMEERPVLRLVDSDLLRMASAA